MAFGFFKKKNYADTVIKARKIYTLDDDNSEAASVAIKEGYILAAGTEDEISAFISEDTEIIDLSGKYILPGFIMLDANCAEEVAGDLLALSEQSAAGGQDGDCAAPAESESGGDSCGYYSGSRDSEKCSEAYLPSEEDMRIMEAYDSSMESRQLELEARLHKKACSSVLSLETDRRSDIYKDLLIGMYLEGRSGLRYFGSYVLSRPSDPNMLLSFLENRRVSCLELGDIINFNSLDISFSSEEDGASYLPEEYVRTVGRLAASHGFCVRFTAYDRKAALTAMNIAGELSESYGKQSFSVRHSEEFGKEELSEVYTGNAIIFDNESRRWRDAASEIYKLTVEAAHAIGRGRLLGSIEAGKAADLAVFDTDPFSAGTKEEFYALCASNIFVSGNLSEL